MTLTEHELAHPLWLKLKEHCEKRLETLRKENERDLNEVKTAKLRGRIAEVNGFLSLENPKPEIRDE